MNNRLKEVRETLSSIKNKKISRQALADDLQVSVNNIESYELGRRSPSNAFIKLFCDKYNINEEWLRTGEGEMFSPMDRTTEIALLVNDLLKEEPDSFKVKFITAFASLNNEEWKVLEKIIKEIAKENSPKD